MSNFDKKKYYEDEILPLILNLRIKCYENKIPFMCVSAVMNDDKVTEYDMQGIMLGSLDLELTDNRFADLMCVAHGVKNVVDKDDYAAFFDYVDTVEEIKD